VQVRDGTIQTPTPLNWYLKAVAGEANAFQEVSLHQYPFVKYTDTEQTLDARLVDLKPRPSLVAFASDGNIYEGEFMSASKGSSLGEYPAPAKSYDTERTSFFDLFGARHGKCGVVCGKQFGVFEYAVVGELSMSTIVVLADDLSISDSDLQSHFWKGHGESYITVIALSEDFPWDILIARLAAALGRVDVSVYD